MIVTGSARAFSAGADLTEFTDPSPEATMAYYRTGDGLVFNGGTTDWACHLDHPAVDRLTRNVLDAVGVADA